MTCGTVSFVLLVCLNCPTVRISGLMNFSFPVGCDEETDCTRDGGSLGQCRAISPGGKLSQRLILHGQACAPGTDRVSTLGNLLTAYKDHQSQYPKL